MAKITDSDMTEAFRVNLESAMMDAGLNAKTLSLKARLNETAVRDILKGRSKSVTLRTVEKLSAALNKHPFDLMSYEGMDGALSQEISRLDQHGRKLHSEYVRFLVQQHGKN